MAFIIWHSSPAAAHGIVRARTSRGVGLQPAEHCCIAVVLVLLLPCMNGRDYL